MQRSNTAIGFLFALFLVAIAVILGSHQGIAEANPSQFVESKSTAATTTLTYMTAGTATTTVVFDTSDGGFPTESAILLVNRTASSTGSQTKIQFEFSMGASGTDCAVAGANCDWYSDHVSYDALNSTTTAPFFTTGNSLTWQFASSTPGGTLTRDAMAIKIETPTRYVHAILTVPIGALNSAIWTEFVGKVQNR